MAQPGSKKRIQICLEHLLIQQIHMRILGSSICRNSGIVISSMENMIIQPRLK